MQAALESNKRYLIVGTGATGLACARFFAANTLDYVLLDSRPDQSANTNLQMFLQQHTCQCYFGNLEAFEYSSKDIMILSPGVSLQERFVATAQSSGVELSSDIEIFDRINEKPVIAITGSNGKTTITTITQKILQAMGFNACAAGNIGLAALDALAEDIDVYVLELSSFQLERYNHLQSVTAIVANISEDHMDRYDDLQQYAQAKFSIYNNAGYKLVNLDDAYSENIAKPYASISMTAADADYALNNHSIFIKDRDVNIDISASQLKGSHNRFNLLAAVALVDGLLRHQECTDAEVSALFSQALSLLNDFKGLPHRCEYIGAVHNIEFINDSKATNVGACLAALSGLQQDYDHIFVLLGGVDKSASFEQLVEFISQAAIEPILFGQDSINILKAFQASESSFKPVCVDKLEHALNEAYRQANQLQQGQSEQQRLLILLSPACASFDQFSSFADRGTAFVSQVKQMMRAA
ncbi:MAG: UDP-N-acetylmuramoyl-L-alanine--D-glutamate ligase [Pseudomonadales bacterium]|nr:UDP-N-acetylmuramoyl-L-alanine--D-glutamate ligase [Pseudomonadales bacterium]